MATELQSAGIYADTQGMQSLKREAEKKSPEALREAAHQFEALFVQQMLKSMRDAQLADGLFDSDTSKYYLEMYDKQIAINMTEGRGMGLADLIYEQLKNSVKQVEQNSEVSASSEENPIPVNPNPLMSVTSDSTTVNKDIKDQHVKFNLSQHQLNEVIKK